MTLSQVTREDVLAAITEYRTLGPEGFHGRYGYSGAVKFVFDFEGGQYPAKGIVGAAHVLGQGTPPPGNYSGGPGPNSTLGRLGFQVLDLSSSVESPLPPFSDPLHLFLVPAGNGSARENFDRSVAHAIDASTYSSVAPQRFLEESGVRETSAPLNLWGCFEGGNRERTWDQLKRADFVVFIQGGRCSAVAQVIAKARSPELSHAIWREDDGEPFQLVYSLTTPSLIDVPLSSLSDWLPSVVRGFMRLGSQKEEVIVQAFGSVKGFVNEKLLGAAVEPITWWVNQGKTYLTERDGAYMWAPKLAKNGRPQRHWTTMTQVQPGDRIVHYRRGAIIVDGG